MKLAGFNYFQRSQVYFNNVPVPTAVNSRVEIVATDRLTCWTKIGGLLRQFGGSPRLPLQNPDNKKPRERTRVVVEVFGPEIRLRVTLGPG